MTNLKINGFKCFEDVDIELNNLTIMAGANSNGKSTSIQAILLMRHTIEELGEINNATATYSINSSHKLKTNISLNGKFCLSLGNSSFVLNRNSKSPISIGMYNNDEKISFLYDVDDRDPKLWLNLNRMDYSTSAKGQLALSPSLFNKYFYYLTAERIGPRVQQTLQHLTYPHAGWQGEQTAQLLDREKGYWKINNFRKFDKKGSRYLAEQTNQWLSFIMPGTRVFVSTNAATLSGQILLENAYTISEPTLSTNLGFGSSYILPILVTGLIAEPGSMFIIENPEAHLHPSAQSKIGRFLAMVAESGVNVVVETHSDHIINGIQIAVAEKAINHNSVTINYYSHNSEKHQPDITPIYLKEKGELTEWPRGFFDQAQIDYAHLIQLKRNV